MKRPGWWTGWWLLKCVLIWLGVFLVWLPVFSRWPNSVPAKVLTLLFVLCLLPLVFGRVVGFLAEVLTIVQFVYILLIGLFGNAERPKHTDGTLR